MKAAAFEAIVAETAKKNGDAYDLPGDTSVLLSGGFTIGAVRRVRLKGSDVVALWDERERQYLVDLGEVVGLSLPPSRGAGDRLDSAGFRGHSG